jgi:hypothetical protein
VISADRAAALQSAVVAVAQQAPVPPPPTPEECSHPAPVTGVMAHEFAHYEGAIGPEGVRRTVTFYGPVVGGLPIEAWHCEVCGLLRLTYPDGRKEERRLYPGPQPGLIAAASPVAVETIEYGRQARVSGLSAQQRYYDQLAAEAGIVSEPLRLRLPVTIPAYDLPTWIVVVGLVFIGALLLLMGILAVYTYSTPKIEQPLALIATGTFVGLLVFRLGVAATRHFLPPLGPSVAETQRGTPMLDGATRAAVTLLVLAVVFLFIAGILAVYTYATPGALGPIFILGMICAGAAALIKLGAAAAQHFLKR